MLAATLCANEKATHSEYEKATHSGALKSATASCHFFPIEIEKAEEACRSVSFLGGCNYSAQHLFVHGC